MNTTDIKTHWFTDTKPYPFKGYGGSRMITVNAGLHLLGGNAHPYFSVTAEIFRPRANDCDACGCLHEDVLALWPVLAPVVALHLCDDNGTPMHAEANGWYYLGGYYPTQDRYHYGQSKGQHNGEYRTPTPDECLQAFADHVRISLGAARLLAESWRLDGVPTRKLFAEWVSLQAQRWQSDANSAIALLDALIADKVTK